MTGFSRNIYLKCYLIRYLSYLSSHITMWVCLALYRFLQLYPVFTTGPASIQLILLSDFVSAGSPV